MKRWNDTRTWRRGVGAGGYEPAIWRCIQDALGTTAGASGCWPPSASTALAPPRARSAEMRILTVENGIPRLPKRKARRRGPRDEPPLVARPLTLERP